MDWNAARAGAWTRAIRAGDRSSTRALYEELGGVLEQEIADEDGLPVLSTPEVNDRIRRRLAGLPGARGLDVGCGPTPVAALALADAGFSAAGVDIATSLLRIARRTAERRVVLVAADGEHLPFRRATFDVATCDDTLEHVFDQEAMLSELARVLRPGGRLLLVTPNASGTHVLKARLRDRLRGQRLPRERYHVTASHVRELRYGELMRLIRPWFRVRSVERVPYEGGRRWRLVNLALRLPGAWRFGPVHFLDLERRATSPGADAAGAGAHYAARVDAESQTSPPCVRAAVRAALDDHRLAGPAAGPTLDVGCGTGGNLADLRDAEIPALGVDVSAAAAAGAATLAPVILADAAALPLKAASFPAVVCTEVLEHVESPRRVMRELARVLRPGGLAVVSSPNYANPAGLHKVLADRRSGGHDWNPWGAHAGGYEALLTGRRLRRALGAEFEIVSVRALDYGQALTGRFRPLDRIAWTRPAGAVLARLIPVLENPRWPLLPWHGMHVVMVLRRRTDP